MGTNPMQKIKRNSMLTGLTVGLVIGLILCAIVYVFLTKMPNSAGASKGEVITVYALNKNIKSGSKVTENDVTPKVMRKTDVPADAVSIKSDVIAKIDLTAGTVLSSGMVDNAENPTTTDSREQEYNMIALPSQLQAGDFVDIRLQLPNGGDYIVVSKKQVKNCNSTTVWLKMNEEEILTMSNAIIEYYIMAGSKLYATKYTDPGMQAASTPTYCPNSEVTALIMGDKNITSQITDGQGKFSQALIELRNNSINKELNNYSEERLENIEKNIQNEIKGLQEAREAYFGTLDSAN